jgi:hypothetical protein
MANIAIDLSPDLDAQISRDTFIVRDGGIEKKLQVFLGVFPSGAAVPDMGYHSDSHNKLRPNT